MPEQQQAIDEAARETEDASQASYRRMAEADATRLLIRQIADLYP